MCLLKHNRIAGISQNMKHIAEVLTTKQTMEGAGVKLHRGFANNEIPRFDPFLLFDDFSAINPNDYLKGFPWHPHRGIETVTYILDGDVRHKDSLGNSGVISSGDIQWMSAGSGIIHEEMPEGVSGVKGFQLWVNIPRKNKMTPPRYQDVGKKLIPEIGFGNGISMHVISGEVNGVKGPIEDVMVSPLYIDVVLSPEKEFHFPVISGHTTFAYVFDGALGEGSQGEIKFQKGTIVLFERAGELVHVRSGASGARFLLISGKPLNESIAWGGPIVMNTQEELQQAFRELQTGEFIKH